MAESNDDLKLIFIGAPKLSLEEIPNGLTGAIYLRDWQEKFRNEFRKVYGTLCKPYTFNECKWAWTGTADALIDPENLKFDIKQTF